MQKGDTKSRDFFKEAFEATKLNGLRLRNRFIKAPTFEGLMAGGRLNEEFKALHRGVARGGVAMTIMANCAVSVAGQSYGEQLILDDRFLPQLEALVAEIHAEGCAVCLQLNHCGGNKRGSGVAYGPSRYFNWRFGKWVRAMSDEDIERTISEYREAARRAREIGIDAIELQASHGFLLSQFLSPLCNHRKDRWGGDVESRAIFAVMVLKAVREAMGADAPVFAQISLSDAHPKGLNIDEALIFAQIMETEGADALAFNSGFSSTDNFHDLRGGLPLKDIIDAKAHWWERWYMRMMGKRAMNDYSFKENFLMHQAMRIRTRLSLPMILTGGIVSKQGIEEAIKNGFDFIALGRALICEQDFILRLQKGELERSACNQCNLCVAYASKGVRCWQNDSKN
ncbi:MAG: NADH:flavin oxidoreductase [Bradymonadales bacterium]